MMFPIEIKANIDGDVAQALSSLGEPHGGMTKRSIWFAEDRQALGEGRLAFLEGGVIVRFRSGEDRDELTVKLRPCTEAQLAGRFARPFETDQLEFRIEEDLAGVNRVLAASLVSSRPQGALLDAVASGADAGAALDDVQRTFLDTCAHQVHLGPSAALGPVDSVKFSDLPLDGLKADMERWMVADLDFLEVSVRVKPKDDESADEFDARAERKQGKLETLLRDRGLALSEDRENKTQRVLKTLAASGHH